MPGACAHGPVCVRMEPAGTATGHAKGAGMPEAATCRPLGSPTPPVGTRGQGAPLRRPTRHTALPAGRWLGPEGDGERHLLPPCRLPAGSSQACSSPGDPAGAHPCASLEARRSPPSADPSARPGVPQLPAPGLRQAQQQPHYTGVQGTGGSSSDTLAGGRTAHQAHARLPSSPQAGLVDAPTQPGPAGRSRAAGPAARPPPTLRGAGGLPARQAHLCCPFPPQPGTKPCSRAAAPDGTVPAGC